MPKLARELTDLGVKKIKEAGRHAVGGVAGLYLYVTPPHGRSWVLRAMFQGLRKEAGLGAYPAVSLSEARDKARQFKRDLANGINPQKVRQAKRQQALEERARSMTFEMAAQRYLELNGASMSNAKHRKQWASTLQTYAYPVIAALDMNAIATSHIMKILEPIWHEKNETASRLRGRMETVLSWAIATGHRADHHNPAAWKGHLINILPAPSKVKTVQHHRSLDYKELPDFFGKLIQREGLGAKALQLQILCANRSGEVRGATWSEFDFDQAVWTVPAHRMKAGKEHRIPLSTAALKLLTSLPRIQGQELVFSLQSGKPLSDMTLTKVLRDMQVDAVPHGMRATFKSWASATTAHSRETIEQALAHQLESKVEAAYQRSDLIDKRRRLMQDWASFCHGLLDAKQGSNSAQPALHAAIGQAISHRP